jgi:hypothetical protein
VLGDGSEPVSCGRSPLSGYAHTTLRDAATHRGVTQNDTQTVTAASNSPNTPISSPKPGNPPLRGGSRLKRA